MKQKKRNEWISRTGCRSGKDPDRKVSRRCLADSSGSTLVIVVCIMMTVVTICLSLLLAASFLSAASRRSTDREQCRILAESVSRRVEEELTGQSYSEPPDGEPSGDSLREYVGAYVCEERGSWNPYDGRSSAGSVSPDEERTFQLADEGWPEEAGAVTIRLYWVNGSGRKPGRGEDWADYFYDIDIDLYVEVTSTFRQESCTLTSVYFKVSEEDRRTWKWSQKVERDGSAEE